MNFVVLFLLATLLMYAAYMVGRNRAVALSDTVGGLRHLNSLPFYYGALTLLWCAIPSFFLVAMWLIFDDFIIAKIVISELPSDYQNVPDTELGLLLNTIGNIANNADLGLTTDTHILRAADRLNALNKLSYRALMVSFICVVALITLLTWRRIKPRLKARRQVEQIFKFILLGCACLATATTVGIIFSVLFESIRFFQAVNLFDFLFGVQWSPQTAIRFDQVGASGSFGAVPLLLGTLLITVIAMLVAVPAGLMSAIYLAEYASPKIRDIVKPALEILAGVPTVVYGFFAALTIAPFIRETGGVFGLDVSSESALAAGLVMGVMIIPFVSSLSDDVISSVPQSLRDGSLGLGATQSETIKQVVIPAALPGIIGGVLLAVSRAIGETMIVVMAAGLAANLSANPLESVTTVTVQIVTLLAGDQEFDSPKTLSAFALGLVLFVITLTLNYIALHVVRKYREQYE